MSAEDKPKIGISTCLLGENVRYNSRNKLDRYLRDGFSQYVQWIPVCPEVDCGLSVPRESMVLAGDAKNPRLMADSGADHTDRMLHWIGDILPVLKKQGLSGFIFKSKSPSCALRPIRFRGETNGMVKGQGIFARMLTSHFYGLPMDDERGLADPVRRDSFIERVFVIHRWNKLIQQFSAEYLSEFNQAHHLQIMAHSRTHVKALDGIAASLNGDGSGNLDQEVLIQHYYETLLEAFQRKATISKHMNVFKTIVRHFKKRLAPEEKQELFDTAWRYHRGQLPLLIPIILLKHFAHKYDDAYLNRQLYINPDPMELQLRYHA